ncbi:MAG: polyprenyl synthetase family protein [Mahellales bacterium]|jgi:geranylgeranyl diphosphate synthase type II
MNIESLLKEEAKNVDSFLKDILKQHITYPDILYNSMEYSLFAGGKRLRPILLLWTFDIFDDDRQPAYYYAAALEFIHTYSLIHDDLPSMDNDDFRRGKPTNHKVFGEAVAILTGDALLNTAYEIMTNAAIKYSDQTKIHLTAQYEIAKASGALGIIGGQIMDILTENKGGEPEILNYIHTHKTGALIKASVRAGAILGNCDKISLSVLDKYSEYLGLAFQIIDDILDVVGNTEKLGKTVGKDAKSKKLTYPSLFGLQAAKDKAAELTQKAVDQLQYFGNKAEILEALTQYLCKREF